MRIGGSLFLIAVGAILKFAITDHLSHVNLGLIGIILMIIGAVALLISIVWASTRRRTDVYEHGPAGTRGTTYVAPRDPYDGV